MSKSRVKSSARNALTGVFSYFITLLLQMINRTVFIHILSTEYLGLSGLFSNVLAMLSLSELGIGTALVYSLYKPIAEEDKEKIKSLMNLYKKIYQVIGFAVLIIGAVLTPFLKYLIKDMPADMPLIYVYYLMYVLDSGLSYFYTYKRSLIICNQNEYISSLSTTIKNIATKLLQIVVLLLTHNYLVYLAVQVLCTRLENVAISKIADRQYPYLKEKNIAPVPKEEIETIKKNTFAMMCHKISGVIVNATDNLIMSKILGLGIVGLISNYLLIIDSITSFANKIMNSLIASIGNLAVDTDKERTRQVFYRILFMNFTMYSFCGVCLSVLLQEFIYTWLGEKYIVSTITVYIFVLYFYISGVRKTVLIFRDAVGLFWNDRYKAIVEAVVNIAVSIPLTYYMGAAGVRLGSIISCVGVAFWVEALILFKKYFNGGLTQYFGIQIKYLGITVLLAGLITWVVSKVSLVGWGGFILKMIICVALYGAGYITLFWKNNDFIYFRDLLLRKGKRIVQKE